MISWVPVTVIPWKGPVLTIGKIKEVVCDRFGLHMSQLSSTDRHKSISLARMLVVYFAKRATDLSFPEIGRELRRHHTTVMGMNTFVCAAVTGFGPWNARVRMHAEELEKILSEVP